MVGQSKTCECDQARDPPVEPQHGQTEDKQQKQIQQRPRREPIPFDAIRTEKREHSPTRWHVQGHREVIGRCLPTRRWNRSNVRRATDRFDRRSADPQFDPLRTGRRILCDQLPLALDAHDSELMVLGHIQTSDLLGLSVEQVNVRHAASVVVEP